MRRALLEVKGVSKSFQGARGLFSRGGHQVQALKDITFSVEEGKTLGIIGESGSGKTTLARVITRLILPDKGTVEFDPETIRSLRRDVQIIFQNPFASLDPAMRIKDLLAEPLVIHRISKRRELREKAGQALDAVGMERSALERFPREFSGGQRQRICIARSLMSSPRMLVLDEPLSSLDLTVQAQLLEIFARLKREQGITYVFITHNLALIRAIADTVLVMHQGEIVEEGGMEQVFSKPSHPYTRQLLDTAHAYAR